MEIIEIRKHSLHNMEHYQFATQVIKLCEEAGIEKLKTLLKTLKDAVAEEDKALNIPRKKEGTADLRPLQNPSYNLSFLNIFVPLWYETEVILSKFC